MMCSLTEFVDQLWTFIWKLLGKLIGKTYPEFSISVDGTPSFAGAECIMVRFVTNKLDIVELVARVGLFEKSLTRIILPTTF